jgi:hypothetical protein
MNLYRMLSLIHALVKQHNTQVDLRYVMSIMDELVVPDKVFRSH